MDGIVLAGGSTGEFAEDICPFGQRALLNLCGKPMVHYVVSALFDSGKIDRVLVVGDTEILGSVFNDDRVRVLPDEGSMLSNAVAGMNLASGLALIATADIPLIDGGVVRAFIDQCEKFPGREFYYPVIRKEINENAYPMAQRTYFKMADGKYTGGNIVMIDASALKSKDKIESLITHRKSAVKMAFDVGLWTLIKMIAGKLPLNEAEEKVCKSLKITGKAIVSLTPEICLDVDKQSDYDTVTAVLSGRGA